MSTEEDKKKEEAIQAVKGKSLSEATEIFEKSYPDFTIRVVYIDGKNLIVTKDLLHYRLNVGVEKGLLLEKFGHYTQDGINYHQQPDWY
jgi:hypothetical protein